LLAGASTWVTIVAAVLTACLVGPCFAFPYSRCAWVWAEREGHLHDGEEDVQALKRAYMEARGMKVKTPDDPT
jgi:predicted NUDIX family NTP pyrophosphohydrolase